MSFPNQKGITKDTAEELMEAFAMFDKNGDGKISMKELAPVLRIMGQNPSEAEVKEMMEEVEKTGFLDKDEFVQIIKKHVIDPDIIEVELRQAFLFFDKDKNGRLDWSELSRVLMHIGDPLTKEDADEFLALAEKGGVDVDEFTKFLCKKL